MCKSVTWDQKELFANINTSSITDNKKFWKTVKPLFSDKISHKETINLVEYDTILSDEQVLTHSIITLTILLKIYLSQLVETSLRKKQMVLT